MFIHSCKTEKPNKISKVISQNISITAPINYDSCKRKIDTIKTAYKTSWSTIPIKEKEKVFTASITETIVPAWIGTQWAYSGTTEVPQKGSIACGYFVTTVLRDAGLPLARIRLAQCASEEMIKKLVGENYIKRFSNVIFKEFISFLQNN